jgi:hypothetical protein
MMRSMTGSSDCDSHVICYSAAGCTVHSMLVMLLVMLQQAAAQHSFNGWGATVAEGKGGDVGDRAVWAG